LIKMEIIDIHVHPRQDKELKEVENLINFAKKLNITRINFLGDVLYYGYHPNNEQIKKINDLTIKLVKKYPCFFSGFCFVNPEHDKKFIKQEIERCIVKGNLKGIKLEASCNASDKRVFKVAEIAEKLNVPILHHAWDTTNINSRWGPEVCQSDPEDIAILAKKFPKVKIIMAHLIACGVRGILEIKNFDNVWAEISGGQPVTGIMEYAVKKMGAERILFGSDCPGRDFSAQLSKVYGAKITAREKELILGINAKNLLGLK